MRSVISIAVSVDSLALSANCISVIDWLAATENIGGPISIGHSIGLVSGIGQWVRSIGQDIQ